MFHYSPNETFHAAINYSDNIGIYNLVVLFFN